MSDELQKEALVSKKVRKLPTQPGVNVVTKSTNFQEILQWDNEGKRITFEYEGDDWKELSEEELKQLSSFTQSIYSTMRQQRAVHDDEVNEKAARLVVMGQAIGSAVEIRANPRGVENLMIAGFRPDQVENAMSNGWRAARKGEIKSGAQLKDGHYEMVRASDGSTEQIWLAKDRDTYWQEEETKNARVMAETEAVGQRSAEAVQQAGYAAKIV